MNMGDEAKVCESCGIPKSLDDYWKHPHCKQGRRSRCKTCMGDEYKGNLKRRMEVDPEGTKKALRTSKVKYELKRDYGLSLEDFDRMLAEQGGLCGICRREANESCRWSVDHDHETGAVRGLVHKRCNLAISFLNESPESCRNAAIYLEKHKTVLSLA